MSALRPRDHLILLLTSTTRGYLDRYLAPASERELRPIVEEDLAFMREIDRDGIDGILAADFVG